MLNTKVDKFLEDNNMTYLFLMLGNLEVQRLTNLPGVIKEKFEEKITETALLHVADNMVPDYIMEESEIEEVETESEIDIL